MFWDVLLCGRLDTLRFLEASCLFPQDQSYPLNKEATDSFEKSVFIYQTTQWHSQKTIIFIHPVLRSWNLKIV
jgi:hypothetical protein